MSNINAGIALAAGVASFISPCCLPLYPSYLSYITGLSVQQLKSGSNTKEVRIRTITHTLAFILGFSAVFTPWDLVQDYLDNFLMDSVI